MLLRFLLHAVQVRDEHMPRRILCKQRPPVVGQMVRLEVGIQTGPRRNAFHGVRKAARGAPCRKS